MNVLVLNPGSNSLKAELVRCQGGQKTASDGEKLISLMVEGIGREATLSRLRGKEAEHSESMAAQNYGEAASGLLRWLDQRREGGLPGLDETGCVGVRVVHGGALFTGPSRITPEVEQQILELGKWAPLHNRSSVDILPAIRSRLPQVAIYGVFDTAFHRTIPDTAGLYAIPADLAAKHAIRRYGFHGISHRYMLERYASLAGRESARINAVTMHLESGCSVTAVAHGRSIDNTMGLTPLEGLMMGTRSGDVDPALIPFLVEREGLPLSKVMEVLNKRSGLLGVSGRSLDTRVLMKEYDTDARVKLAMEMFSYRVTKAVGASLAALGSAEAVIFGGGIAENTPLVRERVCAGLRWCGLEMDEEQNRRLIDIEGRLSTPDSRIQAYVIPVEEGLQIAHECCQAIKEVAA